MGTVPVTTFGANRDGSCDNFCELLRKYVLSKLSGKKLYIYVIVLFIVAAGCVSYYLVTMRNKRGTWDSNNSKGISYTKLDGEEARSEWLSIEGNWYYFDDEGYVLIGEKEVGGYTYKFSDTGALQTGWVDVSAGKMYVMEEHEVATGWQEIDKTKYHFDDDGVLSTGRVEIEGKDYLFAEDGTLEEGWTDYNGNRFYVNQDGSVATGVCEIDKKTYLFDEEGNPETGWINNLGKKCYADNTGCLKTGVQKIDNKYYIFGIDGAIVTKDELMASIDAVPMPEAKTKNSKKDYELIGLGGYEPDKEDINNILNTVEELKACNTAGFVMINLDNGKGVAYNMDSTVYSASCIKGPYMASLAAYKPEMVDKNSNTFIQVIQNSDNKIYSNTRRSYGNAFFADWCEEAGIDRGNATYHYPQLSARSLAKLWIQNYFFLNTDETGRKMKDWFTNPNQSAIHNSLGTEEIIMNDRTLLALTDRTESKAGWICEGRYRATTDGGIIYPKDSSPYIIAICTDIPSNLEGIEPLCLELRNIYKKTKE